MSELKLIMLSAMYENGGNTTHRMLDGHPNLFVYPFESQVGTGAASDMFTSTVPTRYRWPEFPMDVSPEQAYEMFWDEELKTLLRVPKRSKFADCGLRMNEAERKARFVELCPGSRLTRANYVEAYFRATFDAWSNYTRSGKETHYVGYNPVQVFDADKILKDFPNGNIVHVVRNPYSGFADTSRRPFPLSAVRYAWTWNLSQHFALTYAEKYPGRVHIVRFEDLVSSTRATMTKLLVDLDLPMAEQCLYPSFNKARLTEVYPWGTIRVPTAEVNIATANELTSEQKQVVKTECRVMMSQLGYADFFERHLA